LTLKTLSAKTHQWLASQANSSTNPMSV